MSSSLKKIGFSKQEFPASKPILDLKYHHQGFQNDNLFYPFNGQLKYALANYLAGSKTTKSNIDRFLTNPLITPFTEKLSYQNVDK